MPPPTNRDLFVVLVDLKTSSRLQLLDTLYTIKLYEKLSFSKSLYRVYLVNSKNTSNSASYKGVQIFDFGQDGNPTIPEFPEETGESDFFEALQVAVNDLGNDATTTNSKVVTLKVLFLTDLKSFHDTQSNSRVVELVDKLNNLDVFLYIVGVDVGPPTKALLSANDVKEWMDQLCLNLPANLNIVKTILSDVSHSVVCNYNVGLHLFYSYAHFKARQPWKVPLSIGSVLNVDVSTIKISETNAPFNLKNTVMREYDKWVAEEEQSKVYDLRDIVSGIIKHGKFVTIENDASFKVIGPRSFRLLLITPAEDVPEYYLNSEESYVVLPGEDQSKDYYTFFNTFVDELASQNLYVIARRVYSKDNNPKFMALIPRSDVKQKCFIMCGLPYADDIRYPYQEKPVKLAPKVEINQNVYDYLDSIDVNSSKCQLEPPILAPRMMIYPSGLAIIDKLKQKMELQGVGENSTIIETKPLKGEKIKEEWPDRSFEDIKYGDESNLADFNDVDDFTFE